MATGRIENLTGSQFADRLVGNSSANVLTGREGADTLIANAGNDKLIGGLGPDTLNAGAGRDLYAYSAPNEGGDLIRGFVVRDDQIQISASGFKGGLVAGQKLVAGTTFISSTAPVATTTKGTFLYDTPPRTCSTMPMGPARERRSRSPISIAAPLRSRPTISISWPSAQGARSAVARAQVTRRAVAQRINCA